MYLTQGLHRAVQRHPNKRALVHCSPEGARAQTHAQWVDGVARRAACLARMGIQRGDRVALLAPNNDRLVMALFACWWLGAIACPLNTRWSAAELAHALQDSGAGLLLHDPEFDALALALATPRLDLVALDLAARSEQPCEDIRMGGDSLAAILYTGGTTGRSKGVALSHANFWTASMTRGAELNNDPDSVSLLVAPLFHVAGLGRLVGQTLVGGTCITMAQFRPDAVLEAIEQHRISDIIVVPTMLQSLLDAPEFSESRVQSLNRIAFGAAPMPPDLLERALAVWPGAEFFQAYGLTETAGAVCINLPVNHRPEHRARGLLTSVGRAGLGAEIRVVDERGQECPRGTVGEVVVRGPMVMTGYWNNPEATQATVRGGWFHTGDAGRMDASGHLFIVDRLKDMIITGGENVYCAEVEAALRAHDAVAQAAVVGLPDAKWGESVHAVVVLQPQRQASEQLKEALIAWTRQALAHYKCPRAVHFRSELPLSAAGKVLKNLLRDQLRA